MTASIASHAIRIGVDSLESGDHRRATGESLLVADADPQTGLDRVFAAPPKGTSVVAEDQVSKGSRRSPACPNWIVFRDGRMPMTAITLGTPVTAERS
jgi:hypothetical protein